MLVFFNLYDKLFGIFEAEVEKPIDALVTNIDAYNPIKVSFMELSNMLTDFFTSKNIYHQYTKSFH